MFLLVRHVWLYLSHEELLISFLYSCEVFIPYEYGMTLS